MYATVRPWPLTTAEALDGRLRVWTPPAGGTCVRAEIPCGPVPVG
jgi:hypothetical protein